MKLSATRAYPVDLKRPQKLRGVAGCLFKIHGQHGSTLRALPALENGKMQTSEPLILHNTFHSGQCKPRFFHREQARSFFSFTKGSGDPMTVTLQVVAQPLRCSIAQQKMYRLAVSVSGRSKISMSQAILKKSVVTVHHAKASIVNQLCNPTSGYRVPGLQGTILFFGPGKKRRPVAN